MLLISGCSRAEEPLLLQQQAINRIEAYIDDFRKTGDFSSDVADLKQAERELTISRQAFADQDDLSSEAECLVRLGHIQRLLENWKSAIDYYLKADEVASQAKEPALQAEALIGMARAEIVLRDYGAAMKHAEQAVKLSKALDQKKHLFKALDVAAQVQIVQGNLNAAADKLNRAFMIANQINDELLLFDGYLHRGDVYYELAKKCDYERDFKFCLEAVGLARADYTEALRLVRKLNYTGLAKMTEDYYIAPLNMREKLIQVQENIDNPIREAEIFQPKKPSDVTVTEKFEIQGSLTAIMPMYQMYKNYLEQADGFATSALNARHYYIEGLFQQAHGNDDEALKSFLEAVESLEQDRSQLRDEKARGNLLEDKVHFYYAALLELLERRNYTKAFELLERSRSRVMTDLITTHDPEFTEQWERQIFAELVDLKSQIAEKQSDSMNYLTESEPQKEQDIADIKAKIDELEKQYQAIENRISKESPRLKELLISEPASLSRLQESMKKEGYEMLQYLVLEHGVILWHISAETVHVANVFLPRSQLMEKVNKLKDNLSDPEVSFGDVEKQIARELFLYLFEPARQWIKSDRLVIVPHESLNYIPFEVFQNPADDSFLGESYRISYAPSATILLNLKPSDALSDGSLLAVADPEEPDFVEEVNSIQKLYAGSNKVLTERPVMESEFKSWVGDYDVVHLSVHGDFKLSQPLLSYLRLAPGGSDDGQLTAAEMFGLPLEKSRLVVLSACETGMVEATHGNEILGMLRGLIFAGANSVVLSHWEVDAKATAHWMEAFHEAAQTVPPADAARLALLEVKNQYDDPYYWAAFMTVGR